MRFTWVLGIRIQALRLVWHVLYPLNHLPSSVFLFPNICYSLNLGYSLKIHELLQPWSSQWYYWKMMEPLRGRMQSEVLDHWIHGLDGKKGPPSQILSLLNILAMKKYLTTRLGCAVTSPQVQSNGISQS